VSDAVTRRGMLESLLRTSGVDPQVIERIPPPLDDQTAPCSFMQRALWLADDARQSSVAYHVPVLLRIAGPLDYERLASKKRRQTYWPMRRASREQGR